MERTTATSKNGSYFKKIIEPSVFNSHVQPIKFVSADNREEKGDNSGLGSDRDENTGFVTALSHPDLPAIVEKNEKSRK